VIVNGDLVKLLHRIVYGIIPGIPVFVLKKTTYMSDRR
jgi:hypothetical protein